MPAAPPSVISREREIQLLVEVMRLSHMTVLYAEAGADKSNFLEAGVLPLLKATQVAGQTQVCILFDAWNAPSVSSALLDQLGKAVAALGAALVHNEETSFPSLKDRLLTWQETLDLTFVILFDRFEEYLTASSRPDACEFEEELVSVMNSPTLRANFLVSLDEQAAPLLGRLRERITGLGDASIRLSRATWPTPAKVENEVQGATTASLQESSRRAQASQPRRDEAATREDRCAIALVGSTGTAAATLETAKRNAGELGAAAPLLATPSGPQKNNSDTGFMSFAVYAKAPRNAPSQTAARTAHGAWIALAVLVLSLSDVLLLAWRPPGGTLDSSRSAEAPSPSREGSATIRTEGTAAREDAVAPSPADNPTPSERMRHDIRRAQVVAPSKASTTETDAVARPLVYMHVRNEAQRAWVEQFIEPLSKRGIRVSGVKVVDAGPAAPDLRFFRSYEAGEAAQVARTLREIGVPAPRLKHIGGYETRATLRQYELWLASGNTAAAR